MSKITQTKRVVQSCTLKSRKKSLKSNHLVFNADNISKLRTTPLDSKNFQRIARQFFKTSSLGNLILLKSEKSSLRIDFNLDQFGYISITNTHRTINFETKVSSNKDLFIKIHNYNLL
ncbi:hypothetical protein [Joostella sp.]|uniref:hypothetical protein n=1 Tax=Joostella sp. TaxID=2231138 RepID=UPI003A901B19